MYLRSDLDNYVFGASFQSTREPSNSNVRIGLSANALSFHLYVFRGFRPTKERGLGLIHVVTLRAVSKDGFCHPRSNTYVFFRVMYRILFICNASRPPPSNAKAYFRQDVQPLLYLRRSTYNGRTRSCRLSFVRRSFNMLWCSVFSMSSMAGDNHPSNYSG